MKCKPIQSHLVCEYEYMMESQKMPFLAVVRGHASCWKGDANFRSQFVLFDLLFSLKDKSDSSKII